MKKRNVLQLIALVLCAMVLLTACGGGKDKNEDESKSNTYETPLEVMFEERNGKTAPALKDQIMDSLNGLYADEVNAVLKIMEKTEAFEEWQDWSEEDFEDFAAEAEYEYGDNWKLTYKIEEKEKAETDDLKDFEEEWRSLADDINDIVDETEYFDSEDWEDYAYEIGLSVDQTKNLTKELEKLAKAIRNSKVEEAYNLQLTITAKGDDAEDEWETQFIVAKIDGRWISMEAGELLWDLVDALGY